MVERAPQLLDQLTARFDVVVANTGAAWAEQHALLLERSSKALFLIDQRPSSLRACQHALDLCARCGIATGPFLYAVNRCSKNALFTSIDVSCSLRGAHVFELKDGGGEANIVRFPESRHEIFSMPNSTYKPYLEKILGFYDDPMIACAAY